MRAFDESDACGDRHRDEIGNALEFGWPLLIGGVIKGFYDILLLIKFQKVRPPEEAGVAD